MKKFFHPGLFWESIRQMKLIGWMAFIIYALEAILVPLNQVLNQPSDELIRESAMEIHPLMLVLFLAVAPLMVLYLFNYLDKRNGSDFYHAIPVTRVALFVSMIAAILAWCFFLIFSGYTIAILFRLCFGYKFTAYMNILSILQYMAGLMIKCIWMVGLTAIAVSVTGTGFTNVLVTLMLLFVPRALVYILKNAVYNTLPFMSGSAMTSISFFSRFYTVDDQMISTLLLGLLYLIAAGVLFRFRKSETAGQSAPNRIVQAVFRLTVPTLISVWATVENFENVQNGMSYDGFGLLVMYVIAAVVYLLYELVTTRKWKSVAKSLPGLLVLVALNLAAVGGVQLACRIHTSYQPSSGEVVAVQQVNQRYGYYSYSENYFNIQVAQGELKDSALCDRMAQRVTEQTQLWLESPSQYRKQYSQLYDDSQEWYTIRLWDQKGRSHVRKILLTEEDQKMLTQCYNTDEKLLERLRNFPEASSIFIYGIGIDYDVDDRTLQQVYDMFRTEIATMDMEMLTQTLGNYSVPSSIATVSVTIKEGVLTYSQDFPLSPDYFPKTYDLFFQLTTENELQERKKLIEQLKTITDDPDDPDQNLQVESIGGNEEEIWCYIALSDLAESEPLLQKLISLLDSTMHQVQQSTLHRIRVQFEYWTSKEDMVCYTACFALSDEQWKELSLLTKQINNYR